MLINFARREDKELLKKIQNGTATEAELKKYGRKQSVAESKIQDRSKGLGYIESQRKNRRKMQQIESRKGVIRQNKISKNNKLDTNWYTKSIKGVGSSDYLTGLSAGYYPLRYTEQTAKTFKSKPEVSAIKRKANAGLYRNTFGDRKPDTIKVDLSPKLKEIGLQRQRDYARVYKQNRLAALGDKVKDKLERSKYNYKQKAESISSVGNRGTKVKRNLYKQRNRLLKVDPSSFKTERDKAISDVLDKKQNRKAFISERQLQIYNDLPAIGKSKAAKRADSTRRAIKYAEDLFKNIKADSPKQTHKVKFDFGSVDFGDIGKKLEDINREYRNKAIRKGLSKLALAGAVIGGGAYLLNKDRLKKKRKFLGIRY